MLTIPEVAARLKVSERTVRQYIHDGRLAAVKNVHSRAVRVDPAAIDAFLADADQWLPMGPGAA